MQANLLEATQALLDAIDGGDYEAYTKLCDEKLTAFEPEAQGGVPSLICLPVNFITFRSNKY